MLFIAAVSAACPRASAFHTLVPPGSAFVFGTDTLRMRWKNKTARQPKPAREEQAGPVFSPYAGFTLLVNSLYLSHLKLFGLVPSMQTFPGSVLGDSVPVRSVKRIL